MLCVTGATYAYFTATANNNSITGNAASISLELDVKKVTSADNDSGLIPMSNNMIEKALTGENICIDDNGNAVCQVYKAVVRNTSKSNIFVDGYVTLTGGIGEPADYTEYKTDNKNTMRWAQVFCDNEGEDGNVTSCTTAGNSTTRTTEPVSFTGLAGEGTYENGLNKEEIKTDTSVLTEGTIAGNTYNVIGENYIRVSDHDISATTYSQDSDITSALVYNQILSADDSDELNNTGTSNGTYTDSQVYYFIVWLTENGQNQTTEQPEDFFGGIVTFRSSEGSKVSAKFGNIPDASNYKKPITIEGLFNDGSQITKVHIGGNDSYPEVELNDTQKIMKDNYGNYRYYGNDPHNYVEFNDEIWRIISIGNVKKSKEDEVGEQRIKLIRQSSIGSYSYDSSELDVNDGHGVNDWSKSDLATELNDYFYYSSPDGTCYNGSSNKSTTCDFSGTGLKDSGRNLIDDALYYLGGSSKYQELYADDYYNFERGSTVYECSTDSCGGARETKWVGKVGIMYPSDYTYAADLSVCQKTGYDYDNASCKNNDWLFTGAAEWTIAPRLDSASTAFNVHSSGYVYGYNLAYLAIGVRPVVYLKSGVTIDSGEGTEDDPFTLIDTSKKE